MSKKLFLSVLVSFSLAHTSVRADDDPAINDAGLNDVHFVDANQGWAVGDRGAIWHTDNGGRTWQLQPSGTVCSLRSVWFSGDKMGWIVGGQSLPYSPASSGLILATWDGGLSWQPVSWQQYPRLHRVQFPSAKSGWAWGEASEYYPSGLFTSENSGRLWQPVTGSTSLGWLGGFFTGPDSGVLAGVGGATAVVQNRSVRLMGIGSLGSRSIRCVKFSNDGTAWAVADGGVILRSNSLGASWSVVTSGMPEQYPAIFDWHGVHAVAGSVWVVGRPGSVVLQSADSGATWQAQPTGVTVPLDAVWFHDRQRGWAVGALGTILATQDGGRTWQVQRRGGERAAILAVHGHATTAPLLMHVQLGAERGYLSTDLSVVGARPNGDDFARTGLESRLADAVSIAGGTRAECEWRFPSNSLATSLSQVLEDWNRQSEGKAMTDLERRLVVAIRTWRPELLVSDSPDPADAPDSASALVSQALQRAFQSAADATAFPELIESARLQPWSVKRLFTATKSSQNAEVRIDASEPSRIAATAGKPLDDQVSLATSLLAESYRASPAEIKYVQGASRLPAVKPDDSLMTGIVLEPGGPARRKLRPPAEITEAQRRAIQTRRNLVAIVNRADAQPILAKQLNAQVDGWLKELGPEQAGNMLFGLARTHFAQGHWTETRDILEKLVQENPSHLTTVEAHRWLIQYYSSSEARHRERVAGVAVQTTSQPMRQGPANDESPRAPKTTPNSAGDRATAPPRTVSSQQSVVVGGSGTDVPWAKGAVETAKRLMQISTLSWSDPAVQFPLAIAQRMLGNVKDAEKFHTTFSLSREFGPWSDAARSERWIRDRQGIPPKPVLVSMRTPEPPRLDGSFDDPVWKRTAAVPLQPLQKSDGENWGTQIRIAHDAQFLYFAISCNSASGEAALPLRPRTHDMDLSGQDRVDLYLDLDRDYVTYYHLSVDGRGCVFDDCWGDRTWDPTWYVASQSDERGYRIELAIPLSELTDTPPKDGTIWAFNAVRIVPGQRILSWSRPADATPRPEGMGYLLFSDGLVSPPPRAAVAN